MPLPVVAIVGRPNVGKSSLFNALVRERTAIVEPTAGVTRDRVSQVCEFDEVYFELVDTGGHGIVDRDDLSEHVERQIRYAIDQAHLILFLVDAREGLTPLDRATADLLRRYTDRVKLLANKVDEPHMTNSLSEFVSLGFGEPHSVSAHSFDGLRELREFIREKVAEVANEAPPDPAMKIAIVGKRNAGKSTFVNALAGEERMIVSEIPGTTRDSVDVRFEKDGRTLIAIDTAGIRKKNKLADDIEFYAHSRAVAAISRADVVLFLIDSTLDVGQVDKRLAQMIHEQFKPCVIVVNKWDLAKGKAATTDYGDYLDKVLTEIAFAPVVFTSALTGQNVDAAIDVANSLFKQSAVRVGTGQLNQALQAAVEEVPPHSRRGRKRAKFLYAAQVATRPPTIVLFVNDPSYVTTDYERYLLNRFRESLPYGEIPIRLWKRARRSRIHAE